MIIRNAEEKDKEEIFNLMSDGYHENFGVPSDYTVLTDTKAEFLSSQKEMWANMEKVVAEEGGKIIGFIFSYKIRDRYFISDVFVKKEYQNKGVGKLLCEKILKNKSNVYALINDKNEASKHLFKKLNFEKLKTSTIFVLSKK